MSDVKQPKQYTDLTEADLKRIEDHMKIMGEDWMATELVDRYTHKERVEYLQYLDDEESE